MQETVRYMFFIDGTNLLTELSKEIGVTFNPDKPPLSVFIVAKNLIKSITLPDRSQVIRKYWIGSYTGDDKLRDKIRWALREHDFEPVLFKRKGNREKGVDIALTKEILLNAINQNFDRGYLVAGDEDYLSIIQEIKRYGQRIYGAFFDHGLSAELKLSFDYFRQFENLVNNPAYQTDIKRIKSEVRGNDKSSVDGLVCLNKVRLPRWIIDWLEAQDDINKIIEEALIEKHDLNPPQL